MLPGPCWTNSAITAITLRAASLGSYMGPFRNLGQTLPLFRQGAKGLAVLFVGRLVRLLQHFGRLCQGIGRFVRRLRRAAITRLVCHLCNSDTAAVSSTPFLYQCFVNLRDGTEANTGLTLSLKIAT